jgi:hypothetical protein
VRGGAAAAEVAISFFRPRCHDTEAALQWKMGRIAVSVRKHLLRDVCYCSRARSKYLQQMSTFDQGLRRQLGAHRQFIHLRVTLMSRRIDRDMLGET